jgi:type I restriction enzyme S subunit
MSFPRYPRYRPSGVEWLGEVPAHWEVKRLRQIGRLLKGSGGSKEDLVEVGVSCVRYGDLYTTFSFHITAPRGFVSKQRAIGYTPIEIGDVLFAASGEKLAEIGKSAVNLLPSPAVCGGDIVILRPEVEVDHRFLGFSCDSPLSAMQKASMGRGTTIKHIYPDELRQLVLPIPPVPEQRAIAEFLDRETTKIDALIAEQQRLIELLQEKRQAVISHAVTKGLDPNAPMKPSGVEWLGEVPAHWEAIRLRALFRQTKRQDQDSKPVLSVYRDLGVVLKDSREDNHNKTPEDLSMYQLVQPGDLVVNKMKAWQGSLGISSVEGITSPDYAVFVPRHTEDGAFLHLLLRSAAMVSQYRRISNGIRLDQWRLETDLFLNMRVFLPPRDEQYSIAETLGRKLGWVDDLAVEAERAITLFQERRSALISAAVTGQIDVRNAVFQEAA